MPGPLGREALVVSFKTNPADEDNLRIRTFEGTDRVFAAYFSVLYGKRFDAHGALQVSGFFNVPELSSYNEPADSRLPHNDPAVRIDYGIPLQLEELRWIVPLWHSMDSTTSQVFHSAAKYYWQALQAGETDPEVGYLHLITAGEILSSSFDLTDEELIDPEALLILERIASHGEQGAKDARAIRSRLLGIKRRFVAAFIRLVDDEFFGRSESRHEIGRLTKANFERTMSAAYDLRSRYVHSGHSFGRWIQNFTHDRAEVQLGHPVIDDDRELAKVLSRAPTFIGLERVVRYALLRYANIGGMRLPAPSGSSADHE